MQTNLRKHRNKSEVTHYSNWMFHLCIVCILVLNKNDLKNKDHKGKDILRNYSCNLNNLHHSMKYIEFHLYMIRKLKDKDNIDLILNKDDLGTEYSK